MRATQTSPMRRLRQFGWQRYLSHTRDWDRYDSDWINRLLNIIFWFSGRDNYATSLKGIYSFMGRASTEKRKALKIFEYLIYIGIVINMDNGKEQMAQFWRLMPCGNPPCNPFIDHYYDMIEYWSFMKHHKWSKGEGQAEIFDRSVKPFGFYDQHLFSQIK